MCVGRGEGGRGGRGREEKWVAKTECPFCKIEWNSSKIRASFLFFSISAFFTRSSCPAQFLTLLNVLAWRGGFRVADLRHAWQRSGTHCPGHGNDTRRSITKAMGQCRGKDAISLAVVFPGDRKPGDRAWVGVYSDVFWGASSLDGTMGGKNERSMEKTGVGSGT